MMEVDPDDALAFKKYVMERSRDPNEVPSARQRALMACLVIPNEIQKWMIEVGAVEPLLDSIEATIVAAEQAQKSAQSAPDRNSDFWRFVGDIGR
jgi:hypothetical protein